MSVSGIQGQLLEVTVVGCNKLKDTEWFSRQDPYVCLEYASTKHRTRTCTDGGKNPTFQEKFIFTLIEGLREFTVIVSNSNTLTYDDFIGSGKIQLQKVLSQGYDDSSWPLQDKRGRHGGEVRLIMHYANANKPVTSHTPSYIPAPPPYAGTPSAPPYAGTPAGPPYAGTPSPQVPLYSAPPPYPSYPPNPSAYPPSYHHQPAAYPPSYPPPPHNPHYYPQGSYPPPPYPPPPY